jgi:3-dehydroquinate synthase
MPQRIKVELNDRAYDVVVGTGLHAEIAASLKQLDAPSFLLVTDANVGRLHGDAIETLLSALAPTRRFTVPSGESSKSLAHFGTLCDAALLAPAVERKSVIVALGGGVVGDLAGFAASALLRGLRYVQLATSLLAMVDSSVGGKTAINTNAGKNLLGAFWQPSAVFCDMAWLETLPAQEYNSALAEVVKYAVIGSEPPIDILEAHKERLKARAPGPLESVITQCIQAKARIVAQDERETSGARVVLNFGHSVAHVLEARFPGRFLHGEAVGLGMLAALKVSRVYAGLDKANVQRIKRLLTAFSLPLQLPEELTRQDLLSGLRSDKKRDSGRIEYVVSPRIGQAKVVSLPIDDALAALILEQA